MDDKWILSYKDPRKKNWDLFILLLAIFNSFQVYIVYSFGNKLINELVWLKIIDILIDFVFVVDIIIMFFTSFLNRKGEEIRNRDEIWRHYIFTFMFFSDMVSIFGLLKHVYDFFGILSLFKIFRINRLKQLIEKSTILKDKKLVLKSFEYALYYLLMFHFFACGWNLSTFE